MQMYISNPIMITLLLLVNNEVVYLVHSLFKLEHITVSLQRNNVRCTIISTDMFDNCDFINENRTFNP